MKTLQKKYIFIFWVGLLSIFCLDFFTKRWAVSESFRPFRFIENFFYLTTYQKNDGIAFGVDLPLWVQIVGGIVIIYLLLDFAFQSFLYKKKMEFPILLLGCIIGGGIGNLVDRAVNGFVVDFIMLKPFPLFNVADIGITVGLVLLFATILVYKRKSKT